MRVLAANFYLWFTLMECYSKFMLMLPILISIVAIDKILAQSRNKNDCCNNISTSLFTLREEANKRKCSLFVLKSKP